MIAFDLECSQGHLFEGWFNDMASFEEQNDKGLISCPYCNDTDIRKVLSAVATKISSHFEGGRDAAEPDLRRLAVDMAEYINRHFDDVGPDFAKESLKMHYGVAEKRDIRGSATAEEEKTLREEGIQFFKVPMFKAAGDKKN
jgi:hypothetical protein